MNERVDFLVIGLGAMGSAALFQLAKRGAKALGIDRGAPPHALGSSHGETRVTRQALGEGSEYVPLVLDSHRIWRELESETGESLFNACGVLLIAQGTGEAVHHGKPDFLARTIKTAREFHIPHEVLDGEQVAKRFPQFLNLAGNEQAYYEPGGGYVFPERCIKAQLKCAAQLGAGDPHKYRSVVDRTARRLCPCGDLAGRHSRGPGHRDRGRLGRPPARRAVRSFAHREAPGFALVRVGGQKRLPRGRSRVCLDARLNQHGLFLRLPALARRTQRQGRD